MQFQFNSELDYQKIAIDSIVRLFEWVPTIRHDRMVIEYKKDSIFEWLDIIGNDLDVTNYRSLIWENMNRIQTENNITATEDTHNFSIEMETGTGKTYCYLRTIFELHKNHGLKKFIIVVPSVAIRTGVIKTFEQTKSHFTNLYPWVNYNYYDYNSKKIDKMKDFYMSDTVQIMVMTAWSFSWEDKVIHRLWREDVGEKSLIHYMSACHPVMILDEPQSILWTKTKEMIKLFKPLFTLYYSATHKEKFSCMYKLSPSEAYNNGLVKKIQVISLTNNDNQSVVDIDCLWVENDPKGKLFAKLQLMQRLADSTLKSKLFKLKKWDSLTDKTNNPVYHGMRVWNMTRWVSVVIERWAEEMILSVGQQNGSHAIDMIKAQIKQTVDTHFAKKSEIVAKWVKPLTLIFIDKVPNFIWPEEFIQSYFIECLKPHIATIRDEKTKPYAYYFANKKNKKEWTVEYIDELWNSQWAREIEKQMFELIMKEKEQLLSFDNPVEFIFSHSALKEWRDNPNVFTLCTLRNSVSETEKRQSIWRGLRLPVNSDGLRVYDRNMNRLSVIVNQSYEQFCKQYQDNLIAEWYSDYEAKKNSEHIENGLPETIEINPKRKDNQLFLWFWNTINHKTYFSISLSEDQIIDTCVRIINELESYRISWTWSINVTIAGMIMDEQSIVWSEEDSSTIRWEKQAFTVSSLIKTIQNELMAKKVSCSRKTITEILRQTNNITLFAKNPLQYAMLVAEKISEVIIEHYNHSCQYHLSDEVYDMTSITQPLKVYQSHGSYPKPIDCGQKWLFEKIMVDSSVEEKFWEWFQKDIAIDFFFKINDINFKIKTPVGQFTPDRWVVVKKESHNDNTQEIYFVVENKWSRDDLQLKTVERIKIACAKKHFSILKSSLKSWFLGCDRYDKYDEFKREVWNM